MKTFNEMKEEILSEATNKDLEDKIAYLNQMDDSEEYLYSKDINGYRLHYRVGNSGRNDIGPRTTKKKLIKVIDDYMKEKGLK